MKARVDLDDESRAALELDDLLDWIATEARTASGAERVRALRPQADATRLRESSEELREAMRYLELGERSCPRCCPTSAAR